MTKRDIAISTATPTLRSFVQGSLATGDICILVVYVDDILIATVRPDLADEFIAGFRGSIVTTDPAPLTTGGTFRGIRITMPAPGSVAIDQFDFIDKLLTEYWTPRRTRYVPLAPSTDMAPATDAEFSSLRRQDHDTYLTLVGALNWLTNTVPEIAHAVAALSQHTTKPAQRHLQAALDVIQYLKTRPQRRITFSADAWLPGTDVPVAASDAGFQIDRSYTTAQVYLNGGLAVTRCGKMRHTAQSTGEAETNAAAETARLAEFMRDLLAELTIWAYDEHRLPPRMGADPVDVPHWVRASAAPVLGPTVIYIDADNVIKNTSRDRVTAAAKHTAIKHSYLNGLIEKGVTVARHVPTADNPADIGTKPLVKAKFDHLVEILYRFSGHASTPIRRAPTGDDKGKY